MFDHVGIAVKDLQKSKEFYLKALAPLGLGVVLDFGVAVGFGHPGKPFFWIASGYDAAPVHLAFAAADQSQVDAFYEAAIAAGGKDNGKPGLRPQYHPGYYGAFIYDLDGNNVEAVFHKHL